MHKKNEARTEQKKKTILVEDEMWEKIVKSNLHNS